MTKEESMTENIQKISENYFVYHINKKRFIEVEGESVEIEGFPGLDLFIHKPLDLYLDGFALSEGRTGGKLSHGDFIDEIIENIKLRLIEKGIDAFKAIRDKSVEENGLSPRYIRIEP